MTDFTSEMDRAEKQVAGFITEGMKKVTTGLKGDYRQQVVSAGLGERLANTWRGTTYPEAQVSFTPAAYVWTNAPAIIDAFSRGAQIRPHAGKHYLWIPTDNVPRDRSAPRGSQRRAGPHEVELQFNQDLFVRRGHKGHFLAFIKAVRSKNRKGWRHPTKGRRAQGRSEQLVLMFTLVPVVHMPRKLDIVGPAEKWAERAPELMAEGWK